jgi:hypothetical protein
MTMIFYGIQLSVNSEINYPWYRLISAKEPLAQGDIIRNCPVLVPTNSKALERENIPGEVVIYDVIVMSQSCDLQNKRLDLVSVCPVFSLDDLSAKYEHFASDGGKEDLRKGRWVNFHLLNKCDLGGFGNKYIIVDFKNVYGVQFDLLVDITKRNGNRVRLLPPYREHLSQSFARFFMRVGLPIDITPFK